MASKQVRWQCPVGKHPGALGPTKPRRDNAVRYCLECTKETGKLTMRVCPTLEKKREVSAESAKAKREAKAKRDYERKWIIETVDAGGVRHTVDAPKELARLCRLPAFAKTAVSHRTTVETWRDTDWLTIRRRRQAYSDEHISGHAWHRGGMVVTVPVVNASYERTMEVLLHELCHIAVFGKTGHDEKFKRLQMKAAFEAFPEIRGRIESWDHSEGAYVLDRKIIEAMKQARKEERCQQMAA